MPPLGTTKYLNLLLCLSVLTGSTSTTIRHSHQHGQVSHAHGFGFLPLFPSPLPTSEAIAPEFGELAFQHAHFVIFGIEFSSGELPSDQPYPRLPWSPDDRQLTFGFTSGAGDEILLEDSAHLTRASLLSDSSFKPVDFSFDPNLKEPACPFPSANRCNLCDLARKERSGVCLL